MALLSAAALAGIVATATTPTYEVLEMWVEDNALHMHVLERRGRFKRQLYLAGSVTTWRDEQGHEIRDRRIIEWAYAVWVAHRSNAG